MEVVAEAEEAVDLGWLEPEPSKKKKAAKETPAAVETEEVTEEDARVRHLSPP